VNLFKKKSNFQRLKHSSIATFIYTPELLTGRHTKRLVTY